MDDTDLMLCHLLAGNSRAPYSDLAEKLKISIPAVHRRIQLLTEAGIIRGFTTKINSDYLGGVNVYISGESGAKTVEEVVKALEAGDSTEFIGFSSRNFIYLIGLLRNISELEGYVEYVRKAVKMKSMNIGVGRSDQLDPSYNTKGKKCDIELTPLDYRIIKSIRCDSRKPVADIAKELKISSKTVTRHLDKMMESGALDLSLKWTLTEAEGMNSFIMFELKPGADKTRFRAEVMKALGPRMIQIGSSTNTPNFVLVCAFLCCGQTHSKTIEELGGIEGVDSISSDVLQTAHSFTTWRDRILDAIPNRVSENQS